MAMWGPRVAIEDDVTALLGWATVQAAKAIGKHLAGSFDGLPTAARAARRAKLITNRTARQCERLEIASHYARHDSASPAKITEFLEQVIKELGGQHDADERARQQLGPRQQHSALGGVQDFTDDAKEQPAKQPLMEFKRSQQEPA